MPIDLELEKDVEDYYTIVSANPHSGTIKGELVFDDSSQSSTVATNGSLIEDSNNKSGVVSPRANAKTNSPAENIPQSEDTDKEKIEGLTGENGKKFSQSEENIGDGLLEILHAPAGTKIKAGYKIYNHGIEHVLYSVEEIDGRKFLKSDNGDRYILNRVNVKKHIATSPLRNLEITFPPKKIDRKLHIERPTARRIKIFRQRQS